MTFESQPPNADTVAFIIASVPLITIGALANVWYIYWQIRDKSLDVTLCTINRAMRVAYELEESLLFLLITVDRLYFLLRGHTHYRNAATVLRSVCLIGGTWLLVFLLNLSIWSIERKSIPVRNKQECNLQYPLTITVFPVVVNLLMLTMCMLICIRCSQTQAVSGTYVTNTNYDQSQQQLHAREEPACGLMAQPENLTLVENFQPSLAGKAESDPSSTPAAQFPRLEVVDLEGKVSPIDENGLKNHTQLAPTAHKKTGLKVDLGGTGQGRMLARLSHTLNIEEDFGASMETWNTHPKVKSKLPLLLKPLAPRHLNMRLTEIMAMQQLGLLLGIHVLLGSPSYICRLLVLIRTDLAQTIAIFSHWLDWIFLLQTCLYPAIYCLFSDRLRGHLHGLTQCCWRRKHRRVSTFTQGIN